MIQYQHIIVLYEKTVGMVGYSKAPWHEDRTNDCTVSDLGDPGRPVGVFVSRAPQHYIPYSIYTAYIRTVSTAVVFGRAQSFGQRRVKSKSDMTYLQYNM